MPRARFFLAAACLLMLLPTLALAHHWPIAGIAVSDSTPSPLQEYEYTPRACPDGSGGMYVAWAIGIPNDYDSLDPRLQRMTAQGQPAPGWPVGGITLSTRPGSEFPGAVVGDDAGGVYVVWFRPGYSYSDPGVYILRVGPDGTPAPGWPADGITVSTRVQNFGGAVADGAGGVFVAWDIQTTLSGDQWDIHGVRVRADGTFAPGWPAVGKPIAPTGAIRQSPRIIADGAGGFYVAYYLELGPSSAGLRAGHVDAQGNPDPLWPTSELTLGSDPADSYGTSDQFFLAPAPDGFYVVWQKMTVDGSDLLAQHVLASSSIHSSWPNEGLPLVVGEGDQRYPRAVTDGQGGLIAIWEDLRDQSTENGDIYALRIRPDGTRAPGWTENGTVMISGPEDQWYPQAIEDGRGGAFIITPGYDNTTELEINWIQHVRTDASTDPDLPSGGRHVTPGFPEWIGQADAVALSDGELGVYVVWDDWRAGQSDVYAAHLGPGNTTAVDPTIVPVGLNLRGFTRNPARDGDLGVAFTLPRQARGSLALFDLTGRELARTGLDAFGAGAHTVHLGVNGPVPSGVYWLRLTHDGVTRVARGTVIR